jgi:hypothetical protein
MLTLASMKELSAIIIRHCHSLVTQTAIPHLILSRSDRVTEITSAVFCPLLCVVARGRKRIFLGGEVFHYNPETFLVASTHLPVSNQVTEAPYLGLTLVLDPGILTELLLNTPANPSGTTASRLWPWLPWKEGLLDPILRLLRLLDEPAHIPALAPLIEREILYRLLLGSRGAMLRQLATPSSG